MSSIFRIFILLGVLNTARAAFIDIPEPYASLKILYPFDPHGYYINSVQMNRLILEKQPKVVIEFGSWLGMSTRSIAKALPHNSLIYTVDHFLGSDEVEHQIKNGDKIPILYEQFLSNVIHEKLYSKIIPLKMTTKESADYFKSNSIKGDIIYIDASHDFENVYKDLCLAQDLVASDGVICGDDWGWGNDLPIQRAVIKFANLNNYYVEIGDNMWFWKLVARNKKS